MTSFPNEIMAKKSERNTKPKLVHRFIEAKRKNREKNSHALGFAMNPDSLICHKKKINFLPVQFALFTQSSPLAYQKR